MKSRTHGITDQGLTDLIHKDLAKNRDRRPSDHYYLTDLVNMADAYWARKRPDVPTPTEIRARLSYGKKYHSIARKWFSTLPNYQLDEATLNGAYVNIPGVVGRYDFKLGDSLVEFKTYEKIANNPTNLIQEQPHDLEQTIFYAALSPAKPKQNYLTYMLPPTQGQPTFQSYRITIKDFTPIENEIRTRMKQLDHAIQANDCNDLGKCRFHTLGCRFSHGSVCSCETLMHRDFSWAIQAGVTVQNEDQLSSDLRRAVSRDTNPVPTIYELLTPRKFYYKWYASEYDDSPSLRDTAKQGIESCIEANIGESSLGPSADERKEMLKRETIEIAARRRFIKAKVGGQGRQILAPLIVKAYEAQHPQPAQNVAPYYQAELAIQCVRSSIPTGVLVTWYTKLERLVAYTYTFDLNKAIKIVNKANEDIQTAIRTGEPSRLEPCPQYNMDACGIANCLCKQERVQTPT